MRIYAYSLDPKVEHSNRQDAISMAVDLYFYCLHFDEVVL